MVKLGPAPDGSGAEHRRRTLTSWCWRAAAEASVHAGLLCGRARERAMIRYWRWCPKTAAPRCWRGPRRSRPTRGQLKSVILPGRRGTVFFRCVRSIHVHAIDREPVTSQTLSQVSRMRACCSACSISKWHWRAGAWADLVLEAAEKRYHGCGRSRKLRYRELVRQSARRHSPFRWFVC